MFHVCMKSDWLRLFKLKESLSEAGELQILLTTRRMKDKPQPGLHVTSC